MPFEPSRIYHIYNQGNDQQPIFANEGNYIFFLQKMRRHILPNVHFLAYCLMPNHFHWLVYIKEEACLPSKTPKSKSKQISSDVSKTSDEYSANPTPNSSDISKMSDEAAAKYQQELSHQIRILQSSYTKAFNKQQGRSGSLFRQRIKYKDGWINDLITVGSKKEHLLFRPDNDYARQCLDYIHQNPVKADLVIKPEEWRFSSAKDYAGLRNGTLCNQDLARELNLIPSSDT